MRDRILDWQIDHGLDTWEDLGVVAFLIIGYAAIFGLVTYFASPLWGLATATGSIVGAFVGAYLGLFISGRL